MIDNPKWLDLNRRLGELQQHRDALLVDRTPVHPAVEDVTVRIKDLQRQIAAIPRQIASTASAKRETPAADAKNSAAAADSIASQDTEKLDELTAAVETARLACQQAEAAEKQARDAQKAGPRYTIVYARIAETSPAPDSGWQRLMYTTLAAGLLMAFGAGLLSAGANIHPTVASAAEVQAAAGVAVLATIPATSPLPDPLWLSRRQKRLRRMLLAVGPAADGSMSRGSRLGTDVIVASDGRIRNLAARAHHHYTVTVVGVRNRASKLRTISARSLQFRPNARTAGMVDFDRQLAPLAFQQLDDQRPFRFREFRFVVHGCAPFCLIPLVVYAAGCGK